MSNAKWRTVFSTLKDESLHIRQIIAKFTDVMEAKRMDLPWLQAPHALVDSEAFGPFPLVGIEWVEVPAVAAFPRTNDLPSEKYTQDIVAARSALVATGKRLPLEDTVTGLRIVGHTR